MKKTTSIVLLAGLSAALSARGQELTGAYRVLNMPLSSHVAALGGAGISLVEDSPWAGWFNPSLYASVSDRSLVRCGPARSMSKPLASGIRQPFMPRR